LNTVEIKHERKCYMKKRNYIAVLLSFFMTLTALIGWAKTKVIAEDGPK